MQRKARVTDTRHHLSPLFFSSRMKSGHRVGWRHLHVYKRIRAFRPRASLWFPSLASLLSHSSPQVDRNSRWILIRPSEKRSLSLSLFLPLEDLADNGSCKWTWAASDKLFRTAPFQSWFISPPGLSFGVSLFPRDWARIEPDFRPRVESFSRENTCETNVCVCVIGR